MASLPHLAGAEGIVRAFERDVLLFLLAIAAGSADGWSYFGLGHAFVANMTGNTVLLGMAVFREHGDLLHPLICLSCYVPGVAIASLLTKKTLPGSLWSKAVSWTLLLEAILLATSQVGWMVIQRGMLHLPDADSARALRLLLGCVAFAVGLQSGAMVRLKIPGIVTTYITGTWTTLVGGLTSLATGEKKEAPREKVQLEERLLLQAGVLALYFLAAVTTGAVFRYLPAGTGVLPASAVLLVAVYGAVRCRA
jgi:uncharacterized membrane protein YoaK (UPF0700 family)